MGRTPRRARLAAAALAVSLVALPFVVAAGSAYAATPPPQVTSPVNGSYVAPTDLMRFEGVDATYGYGIEVLVDDAPVCFTESTPEGVWFCETEAGIAEGPHTVVAQQTVDAETSTGTVVGYTIGVAPEPEPEPEPEPPVEEPVEPVGPPVVTPVEPPAETPAAPPIGTPAEVPAETPAAAPTVEPAPPAAAAPAAQPPAATPALAPLATVPTVRALTAAKATPLAWTLTVAGVTGPLRPGQSVTLASSGLPAGSTVSAELHSTPVALGSTTVAADGTFSLDAIIPLSVEAGDHHFVVSVTAPGAEASVTETPVTIAAEEPVVVSAAASGPTDDTATATSTTRSLGAAGPVDRDRPGAPNSLSTSLAPAWEVLSSPVAIVSSVVAGLVFLVLVAFPSELLGATIQRRYQLVHRTAQVLPPGIGAWFARRPVFSGVGLIALATLITGFSDPHFGADAASVRLLLACFIAALIVSYGTYLLLGWFLNRTWSLPTSLNLRPLTLVITVIGVVLSRVLDFSPGFLFGLMLGLTFPAGTTHALRSHARLLRTLLIVAIAVTSWFAYSALIAATGGAPTDFAGALLQDTLAALSTEGLTGMLIAMLPFLYLDGREIWQHSKRSWAVSYSAIVVVFFLVVAPKPSNWADLGPKYATWAIVLGVYAVVALAAYYLLHRSEQRASAHKQLLDA